MTRIVKVLSAVPAILALCVTANAALAGGGTCDHCGRGYGCATVCRLVKTEKEIEVTCWDCRCEDFCVAGHSRRGRKHVEEACGPDCGKGGKGCAHGLAGHGNKFVWYDYEPGCAKVRTKKKLYRKTVTKKVPSYKWVIEDLCKDCDGKVQGAEVGPGVPQPPAVDARLKYRVPDDSPAQPEAMAPVVTPASATSPVSSIHDRFRRFFD